MKLQRLATAFTLLAALGVAAAPMETGAQGSADRKPRVAVLDFDYGTVMSASSAIFGTNVDLGKGISSLLVTDLDRNGAYTMIDRSALNRVLAEQNFSNSNRADPSSAARIGKILGADYVIIGTITKFGNETNQQKIGGMGANLHGLGLGGIGHSNSKAEVAIDARIINIDTAEILAAAEGKGESSRSSMDLAGLGAGARGMGAGNVDFGSSNFQNTIIGEATKKAVDALAQDLGAQSGRLNASIRTFTGEGLVAAVDSGQVILNVGRKAGIKTGDQLQVTRMTREIKDPVTGQVLRRMTSTIGVIQATDVDDASAICNIVSGSGFQVGDRVTFTTDHPVNAAGNGKMVTDDSSGATPSASTASINAAPATASSPANSSSAADQPNFVTMKAEFVPGEKTILSDDFSDMIGDEPPPHWKIRGATPELRVDGNLHELLLTGDRYDIFPNFTGLPKNFTMEYEVYVAKHDGLPTQNLYFHDKTGKIEQLHLWFGLDRFHDAGKANVEWRIGVWDSKERLGQTDMLTDWSRPVKINLWVQNGRIRVYINGVRTFDFNQVQIGDIDSLQINFWSHGGQVAIRNFRLAESAPDFGQTIMASGKFVTHGILFDTDSDHIKPESAAVIQMIAKVLQQSSDLKVEIDGHTDSTGNAAHNLDLSQRRAIAVKNILVSQFGIDAARLSPAGFGSTKPIDNNNTAEGKANNRRVEFVRK